MKKFSLWLLVVVMLLSMMPVMAEEPLDIPDLFFYEYADLTDEYVRAQLDAAPLAPVATDVSAQLAGQAFEIVTAQNATLKFDFSEDGASVAFIVKEGENDPIAIESQYAALELGDVVLFAFRVPDSATAWIVEIDLKKGLAVAVEAWFAQGVNSPARETQRALYTGYVAGDEVPAELLSATNRLTGKAILWEGEMGQFLTTYATRSWSSYVPLHVPGPKGTFTGPSDYYDLNGHQFFYSRSDIEFSGALVVEVLDLYTMQLIGARLGFDEQDQLVFRLYRAAGRVLGQYATYGPFGSAEYPAPRASTYQLPKGFRMAYRPFRTITKMTLDEVTELTADAESWYGAFLGEGKEKKMMPLTDRLSGMAFSLDYDDGAQFEYEFIDASSLRFREKGEEEWHDECYQAFEVDDELVFFTHQYTGKVPREMFMNVVDLKNGLTTMLHSSMTNEVRPREPVQDWKFGAIDLEGLTPVNERHHFTKELVGRSFTWTYNDSVASQHIFTSPDSYSWSIIMNGEPSIMWSAPGKYVKIRDEVYMVSWIEARGQGIQGTYVVNTKTMHDCGTCFGLTDGQLFESNTFGAEGRSAGQIDVTGIY